MGIYIKTQKVSEKEEFKPVSLINHEAFQYYIRNSKIFSRDKVAHYVEHGKLINEFYKIVEENIVESEGGVHIKGLGYFGIMRNTRQVKTAFNWKTMRRELTKGDSSLIAFVPTVKLLYPWTFDFSWAKIIKRKVSNALKSGYKYKFNASLFFKI